MFVNVEMKGACGAAMRYLALRPSSAAAEASAERGAMDPLAILVAGASVGADIGEVAGLGSARTNKGSPGGVATDLVAGASAVVMASTSTPSATVPPHSLVEPTRKAGMKSTPMRRLVSAC